MPGSKPKFKTIAKTRYDLLKGGVKSGNLGEDLHTFHKGRHAEGIKLALLKANRDEFSHFVSKTLEDANKRGVKEGLISEPLKLLKYLDKHVEDDWHRRIFKDVIMEKLWENVIDWKEKKKLIPELQIELIDLYISMDEINYAFGMIENYVLSNKSLADLKPVFAKSEKWKDAQTLIDWHIEGELSHYTFLTGLLSLMGNLRYHHLWQD